MKKLFLIGLMGVFSFTLVGCGPMMVKKNNNKVVAGNKIFITSDKRIVADKVNLILEINESKSKGFDLNDFREDIISTIRDKGIILSNDGVKVYVTINYLYKWGNVLGKPRASYGTGIAAGLSDAFHLGFATRLLGELTEGAVQKHLQHESADTVCKTSNCAGEVNFVITSKDGFSTNVVIRQIGPVYGYQRVLRNDTANSIAEFFVKPKK